MRVLIVTWICLTLLELFSVHASSDLTFKILTWNTGLVYFGPLYQEETEGFVEPSFESRTPDKYLPHIAEVISRVQPDFIALQEMKDDLQAKKLSDLLRAQYDFLSLRGNRDRAAVLFWRKTFPVLEVSKMLAPGAREFPLIKIALEENQSLSVSSVHLSAFNVIQRGKQVDFLNHYLEKNSKEPIILAGDFNFQPTSSFYEQLTSLAQDLTSRVSKSTIWGTKIDYVFLRNLSNSNVQSEAQELSGVNLSLMDHLPLLVTITLTETEHSPNLDPAH